VEPILRKETTNLEEQLNVFSEALDALNFNLGVFVFSNLALQILFVLLSIMSTVFMALQDEYDRKWMKTWGIISTTLSAGIVTIYAVFHVKESIIMLSAIETEIINHRNDLNIFMEKNPTIKDDLELRIKYTKILNELGAKRRATWRGIGKQ